METVKENKIFSRQFYLLPGECNSEQEMPLWLLVNRIIEVATLHADSLGIGYKRLSRDNQAWVLSRLAIEMERYPKVGENYTLSTWIESFNRHFSERNIEILDENDHPIGYARTIWSVIDTTSRTSCDISALCSMADNVAEKECPIEHQSKIKNVDRQQESRYTFRYSDIDFNRHVNTVRYICAILNMFPLQFYDAYSIHRFEITFIKETYIDTEVIICIDDSNPTDCKAEISDGDTPLCRARIAFSPRNKDNRQ